MVHEQMSRFYPGLPPRRASDGGHGRLRRRAVGLLSRLHRHLRSAPAHGRVDPHDRQDADAGRDGLQIFDRPAVHLSEERARLRVQLPAHVLCGAVRGVQGQSGAGARDGPHLHPARRPRAERLDLDGAARRLLRRQSVRLHRRRLRLPVGPGAWRRQRGRAQDAGARSARVERIPEYIKRAKDKNDSVPPDGLRPPRLQELRSARQDHAEDLPRGARTSSASRTTRCSTSRMELERIALQGRVLHREEALSEHRLLFGHHAARRWASRPPCSPCCSRSPARSAGSRSGRR